VETFVDIATIVLALFAAGSFFVNALYFRRHILTQDIDIYLRLDESINRQWRKMYNSREDELEQDILEFLNLMEIICHLYIEKRFFGSTKSMIEIDVREYLEMISKSSSVKKVYEEAAFSPESFKYMKQFARNHGFELFAPGTTGS
jgi:hypothetical protein